MSEDGTNIQKTRATALKIIVDEAIVNDVAKTREFMAKLFDMPKLLETKDVIKRTCLVKDGGRDFEVTIEPKFAETMISAGFDLAKLPGFKEAPDKRFLAELYVAGYHIQKLVGATDGTDIMYEFTSSMTKNDVKIFYILFSIKTSGKTKTEIKGKHKENVSKLLHFLRMNAIPVIYDCEWKFTGNRACHL
ncbi:MAG: hypothetical protein OIN86_10180 [Candidatus Methanoperedens sp.]|nr:hypothetical protein [Candidatus Methanoperedens sp.]CAG0970841.1 hypothetical protein METP1_01232 [Methanosarcinales archaeon]